MKALVKDNVVVDVSDEVFPVHPLLTWIDSKDQIAVGYSYSNGIFMAPPSSAFDTLKTARLLELSSKFNEILENTHCMSSVGFEVNANKTARQNIEDLILILEPGESILFRAYDNSFHEISREQLEIIAKEIAKNCRNLYQAKWRQEAAIKEARNIDELNAIE